MLKHSERVFIWHAGCNHFDHVFFHTRTRENLSTDRSETEQKAIESSCNMVAQVMKGVKGSENWNYGIN